MSPRAKYWHLLCDKMATQTMSTGEMSDAELVGRSLAGDRNAFAGIVMRYQTLICSLAYSATGNLAGSEDLSQETFLAAWTHLPELREPNKLRSWLCGIVRNLNHRDLRSRCREPVHGATPLDQAQDTPGTGPLPRDQAVSSEEEAILWRSLDRIPDNYREPLILFYREHQSIERVAEVLELSEDVVRQRLSRGRKVLQEEVAAFVEGALRRSSPSSQFSESVMAALPFNVGLATATGTAKGSVLLSLLSIPAIGLLASAVGTLGTIRNARTADERQFKKRTMAAMWADCGGLVIALTVVGVMRAHWGWTDQIFTSVMVGCYLVWAMVMAVLMIASGRGSIAFFLAAKNEGMSAKGVDLRFRILATVCAMTAGALAGLIHYAWRAGDSVSVGILATAGTMVVVWTLWGLYFPKSLAGSKVSPSFLAWMPTVVIVAAILLVLNWRLGVWIAAIRGANPKDGNLFLPMWTVHVATLVLLAWIGILALVLRHGLNESQSGPRDKGTL
jgi:RNA polymerase sigma factor (sigma-70 family)